MTNYETNNNDSLFGVRDKGKTKELQINYLSKLLNLFHIVQNGKSWIEVYKEMKLIFKFLYINLGKLLLFWLQW